MGGNRALLVGLVVLGVSLLGASAGAWTVSVNYDTGTIWETTALTGYATSGDMMDGMEVTAGFASGGSETATWADVALGQGQAAGTDWTLFESGDTWDHNWELSNGTATGIITSLLIDAGAGDTVFDVWADAVGTDGSAYGLALDVVSAPADLAIVATYSGQVALSGYAPVGDLYRYLSLEFTNQGGLGSGEYLIFRTDTDNLLYAGDIEPQRPIPEPATVLLLGLGIGGLGVFRRRK